MSGNIEHHNNSYKILINNKNSKWIVINIAVSLLSPSLYSLELTNMQGNIKKLILNQDFKPNQLKTRIYVKTKLWDENLNNGKCFKAEQNK